MTTFPLSTFFGNKPNSFDILKIQNPIESELDSMEIVDTMNYRQINKNVENIGSVDLYINRKINIVKFDKNINRFNDYEFNNNDFFVSWNEKNYRDGFLYKGKDSKGLKDGVYKIQMYTILSEEYYKSFIYDFNSLNAFTSTVKIGTPYISNSGYKKIDSVTTDEIIGSSINEAEMSAIFDSKIYIKYDRIYNCFKRKLKKTYCDLANFNDINCESKEIKDLLYLQNAVAILESFPENGININYFNEKYVFLNYKDTNINLNQSPVENFEDIFSRPVISISNIPVEFYKNSSKLTKDFSNIVVSPSSYILLSNIQKLIDSCLEICCCDC